MPEVRPSDRVLLDRAAPWLLWAGFAFVLLSVWPRLPGAPAAAAAVAAYLAAAAAVILRRVPGPAFRWVAAFGLSLDVAILAFQDGSGVGVHALGVAVIFLVAWWGDFLAPIVAGVTFAAHDIGGVVGSDLGLIARHFGPTVVATVGSAFLAWHVRGLTFHDQDENTRRAAEAAAAAALARQLAEERRRLADLLDHLPVGVLLAEPDPTTEPGFRYVLANREVGRILRHAFRSGGRIAQYRSFAARRNGQDLTDRDWPAARALAGDVVRDEEVTLHRHDGSSAIVAVSAGPIRSDNGTVVAAVMTLVDITARKEAEQQVEASRRTALAQEQLSGLGSLVAGVAHEVKTPLTYISNNMFLIDRILADPSFGPDKAERARRLIREAQDGVDRIVHLVRNLRSVTRTESTSRVKVSLDEVVAGAVELFRATHRWQVEIDTDLRSTPLVDVDRIQIQQVTLNLLLNAGEAMATGGRIRVRTARAEGGARLTVVDEGPGIPLEIRPRLFDPFFTTKSEGMGLGLAISRRFVEEHGGRIWFETVLGQGTAFHVQLPSIEATEGPRAPAPHLRSPLPWRNPPRAPTSR